MRNPRKIKDLRIGQVIGCIKATYANCETGFNSDERVVYYITEPSPEGLYDCDLKSHYMIPAIVVDIHDDQDFINFLNDMGHDNGEGNCINLKIRFSNKGFVFDFYMNSEDEAIVPTYQCLLASVAKDLGGL